MWPVPPTPPPDHRQSRTNGPWIALATIVAAIVIVAIIYLATSGGGRGY